MNHSCSTDNMLMRGRIVLICGLCAALGCGKDTTVTVGEPGEKGVVRDSIDTSRNTADVSGHNAVNNDQMLYEDRSDR